MTKKGIRYAFMAAVMAVAVLLCAFLLLVNMNRLQELKHILGALGVLVVFMLGLLLLFFWKGEIYDEKGHLEKNRILTMTTTIFLIAQMTFAFAVYANQKMMMTFQAASDAQSIYAYCNAYVEEHNSIQGIEEGLAEYLERYEEFDAVFFADRQEDTCVVTVPITDTVKRGETYPYRDIDMHTFPVQTNMLCMRDSTVYQNARIWNVLAELLTVMAASVFLTIELMLFVMKLIDEKTEPSPLIEGKKEMRALSYVRQLAFLFYFASCLPSAFLSVMAKTLGGSFLGITGNVLAGLPQSAETLFTCTAIFGTSLLIEKKGWKLPFTAGLLLVAAGNIFTALAENIALLILARSVVGLGYGFCWMTFRNFALFGRNEEEKAAGFSLLNAGLYAGMNCGSVLGAVLAEKLGYRAVLLIAAAFTLLCSVSIAGMENQSYKKVITATGHKPKITLKMLGIMVLFILLMVAPTCIAGSYLKYYLPLYFTGIGHSIADVGRAQLLYGVLIVYAGPVLARAVAKRPNYFVWNLVYNGIVGGAFILFGMMGHFLPAFMAVALISMGDSFGFVAQNIYFTRMEAVKRMGDSMSMSLISFLKKIAEMLGPIVFGLVMTNSGTVPIGVLGVVFILFTGVYYICVRYWCRE